MKIIRFVLFGLNPSRMRRAALSLLLRIAEAEPTQQSPHRGQLTKLQAVFLQAAGHVGLKSALLLQLPSQLGCALARTGSEGCGTTRNLNTNSKTKSHEADGQDGGGAAGVAESVAGGNGKRRQRFVPVEDACLYTLPLRVRSPGRDGLAPWYGATPQHLHPLIIALKSRGAPRHHEVTRRDAQLTPTSASHIDVPVVGNVADASFENPATEEHTGHTRRQPPPSRIRRSSSTRPPSHHGSRQDDSSCLATEASSRPWTPRGADAAAGAAAGGGAAGRHWASVPELLDELEKGVPPPPPRALLEVLERWRHSRRDSDAANRRGGEDVRSRLDSLLTQHLRGAYGRELPVKSLVLMLWSLVKGGLTGEAALALVSRLEDVVRPGMPYGGGSEYWASLAFYSLGLAQQAAAGVGGGDGAAARRGGGGGSPAAAARALVERSRRRLVPALLGLMRRNAHSVNLQALSNTFWAVGLLQITDRETLARMSAEVQLRAGEAQSQNVANILYGCAVLGLGDRDWAAIQGPRLAERLVAEAVRGRLAGYKAMEVSCVAWAACKLGVKITPVLEAVVDYIGRGGFDGVTSLQVWANTLYAMGVEDFYDPRVFQKLSLALVGPEHRRNLQQHQQQPPGLSPAVAGGGSSPAAAAMRAATAQTFGNMLFAMGALRHIDEAVVDVLMGRLTALVAAGRATVVDIALAARACAQLNYRPPSLDEMLDAAMPTMRAQAHRLMAYNVLWSLLTLDMLGDPRHQPLVRYLVSCVNQYGTNTWKSVAVAAEAAAEPPALAGDRGPVAAASAYDDLTQLVQYHLESRYLGLTGEEYDLKPPQGIDAVVRQIRERRQYLAAQSSTVVHRYVVSVLEGMMAAAANGKAAEAASTGEAPHPRILAVESEVMVEPELIVVDVLLTLERPTGHQITPGHTAVRSMADQTGVVLTAPGTSAGGPGAAASGAAVALTYKVALEVDGPHHFMRNRPDHKDGASAYRDRVLRRRFGADGVVVVPTSTWVEKLRDDDGRRRFLAELLAGTAPPPPRAAAAPPPPLPAAPVEAGPR